MMNYDMSESIARSDSFDLATYTLDLDVTEYNLHQLSGRATIAFEVLNSDATNLWFDLVELTVDSVHLDGTSIGFDQGETELHIELPEGGWVVNTNHSLEVWYGGLPYQDPYWGGLYFASDYIYNLGIG